MMHITLKRLEAPGSLEVRWGWVLGHPRGDRGREGGMGCRKVGWWTGFGKVGNKI